jgi:exopolysaccharide biosynthesis polyprenyl glycosylphosphotransferase
LFRRVAPRLTNEQGSGVESNEISIDAVRRGDLHGSVSGAQAGDGRAAVAAAALAQSYEPALATTGSGEAAGVALVGPPALHLAPTPVQASRRHMPPFRVLAPALVGSLAVIMATALAIVTSADSAATIFPAAAVAVAAWCSALQYMYSGGALSPMTLGTPVASAVAGMMSLVAASAAVVLLPAMQVVHRTELLIMAAGVVIGASLYEMVQRNFGPRRKVLVIGAGNGGADLVDELRDQHDMPFECLGVVDDPSDRCAVLGSVDNLSAVIERECPDLIVLAGVEDRALAIERIFEASRFRFRVVELNHFYEDAFGRLPLQNLTPAWFMGLLHLHRRPYSRASKRAFDLVITAIGIVPVALLLPLVAVLVRCSGPGAILFKQVRLGEGGKLFKIYKFRTMVVDAERQGVAVWASAADPRITPVGRFMRRTRLDELPQLWNVLRGDMSIVGPRPERPEFLEQLAKEVPFWERRHLVKPGITGWAQVRCGYTDDSLGAAEKLSHDLYYLKHRSLLLDLAIAAKTAAIVVRGTGAH